MGRRTGLGQCAGRHTVACPPKWAPRATCLAELVPVMVPGSPLCGNWHFTEGIHSPRLWKKILNLLTGQE